MTNLDTCAPPCPPIRSGVKMHWGVLGGGILGMTLAHELAKRGFEVTLCEAANEVGGLASAWTLGDIVWDRHYHVMLLSDASLRALLAELDLEEDVQWRTTRTGFFAGGQLHSLSDSLEFLRFPPLNLIDKARLAATILHASRIEDGRALEDVTAAAWLRKWSGANTFEKIWLPLLRSKFGENYATVSAAFIWATIRRMYAARREGLKKEMFGYAPGGYARILRRFRERLESAGVRIRLGAAATLVESASADRVAAQFDNGHQECFDQVVLTMPAPIAARICGGLNEDERERLSGIRYQGIVCASLLLEQPLADFYVTNITDPGLPFTGVIEMSALVDRAQFGGRSLVYLPKYVASDDPCFSHSDEHWREEFLMGLKRMYPRFRRTSVTAFRISRAKQVFAVPTLGYSRRLPPMRTSIPGVHVLNSAHILNGTLNVNETIQLAQRGAAELATSVAR
jgi:protoporphyrinogen oxidase